MLLAPILALALIAQAPVIDPTSGPPLPATEPAKLPLTVQFDLPSKITGRTYRIYVSKPVAAAPKGGFPVLYVLDADMAFPTAGAQVLLGSLGGRAPAIVVGIGYPNTLSTMVLRGRDMTPSKPTPATLALGGQGKPEDYGGAEDFHRFMTEELRPLIARMNSVDPANQSLMGYSLGGLFTLHVLFKHPSAYQTYVAGSPSIWWNDREVLKGEAGFAEQVRAGKIAPRLLITSDEWEQSEASPDVHASGEARARDLKEMNGARMVDNARDLAGRLKAIKGAKSYEVCYALFPQETHQTGIPASTSRGVAFVIKP